MRKTDKLYTANKWNQPLFADVDRDKQNIFDGLNGSTMQNSPMGLSVLSGYNQQPNMPNKINLSGVIQNNAYNDYMNSTGNSWLGIKKKDNPFSKQNVGTTMKGIGAGAAVAAGAVNTGDPRGLYDTLDPVYHLAGGRESGAGNAMSDAGVGLFNAGAQSGNPWLMLAGAGAKVLGGLTNAAFGLKTDKDRLNRINQNIADFNSSFGASSLDDIKGFGALANPEGIYKGGWFSGGKAKRKNEQTVNSFNNALSFAQRGQQNTVDNMWREKLHDEFADWYALGGPLGTPIYGNTGMGAIDYGFMSDYLTAKNKQAENKNTASNPFAGVANNFFSDGGGIHIKHPGRLTELKKRTGKTEAELWAEGRPEVKKMITFARNARKWKKAYGGFLDAANNLFALGGDDDNKPGYGGGKFWGSGAGGEWEEPTQNVHGNTFNEAYDDAVKKGLKTFKFQGRLYNTKKEHNPVREFNNRWAGDHRMSNEKNPSKAYDVEPGILGGPLANIPIVTDTYVGSPERPPQIEYNPDVYDTYYHRFTMPTRSSERHKIVPGRPVRVAKDGNGLVYAFGGDMQTNSADFSTGLTHIDAGQSHEENPYDGVQLGVDSEGKPNLVEENETVYNDYVYSDRIFADAETLKKFHLPKKAQLTYADITKRLEKEIKERPNDPISQASFQAQMESLAEQQERQKQEMEAQKAQEAFDSLTPEEKVGIMQYAQQQEQAAQEQAMQQEAMAQQAQMQQPSPEEIAMAEQQQGQPEAAEEQPVMAEGGHLYPDGGKKNVGTWKDDKADHWGIFTKPGLRRFLENAKAQIDMAPDDKKDEVRRKIMNDFNTLQQSYNDYVAPTLGSDRYEYSEGILNHQKDFDRKYGNTGFYSTDDNGNITNLIADAINLPQGAATEDKPSNWYDGYNGPRTSIRNFGSTEYGNDDYYKDLVEGFGELGLTYAPNENWKYGPDGNYQLYGLSIPEDIATAGEAPTRRWDYNTGTWTTDTAPASAAPSVATPTTVASNTPTADEWEVTPNYKNDKLRYAGLFGPAVGLGMQLMGIGKPDTGAFDNILEGYDRSGAALADYQPIGNYLRYNPMDIWFEQNRLNANARATDRAILNSGSNQGSKAAALLASGYNTQTASGDLYRKGLEYNEALKQQVAGFNRGTDQFNAEAYNRTALQNAETLNRQRQYRAQLGMQAAAQKADLDAGWYNGIYGNVAGLFKGIGDLGRENAQHNMIAEMAADGIFGSMSPRTNTGRRGKYLTFTKKACGGKLNKKKGGK